LVWTYYVKQGKFVRDKGIIRGNILVMTEEQWRERWDGLLKKAMWKGLILIVSMVTVVFMIPIIFIVATNPIDQGLEAMVLSMMLILLMVFTVPIINLYQSRRHAKRQPAPGLYAYGLQQSPVGFIPYGEIASTERKAIGWPKKQDIVVMNPRYPRKVLGFTIKTAWNILIELIGEEGAKELEARVRSDIGPHGPPELHIYGTYK
jgi:hypothetical protein